MERITEIASQREGAQTRPISPWLRAICGLTLLAATIMLGLLAWRNPGETRGLPPCPSWWFAGVYCPGCGGMRTLHFVLTGQFGQAWRHNPLMLLVGVPLGAVFAAALASVAFRGRWWWPLAIPTWLAWTLVAAVIGFGVLRNVPLHTFDPWRPPLPGWMGRT